RVGLQKVFKAPVTQTRLPSLGADDSHCHRLAHAERIADGEYDVADTRAIRITQRKHRQVISINFQHREIAGRIGTNHLRVERTAVAQVHFDLLRAVNYVMIGHDVTILTDDDARTERLPDPFHWWRLLRALAKEAAKERIVHERKLLRLSHAHL